MWKNRLRRRMTEDSLCHHLAQCLTSNPRYLKAQVSGVSDSTFLGDSSLLSCPLRTLAMKPFNVSELIRLIVLLSLRTYIIRASFDYSRGRVYTNNYPGSQDSQDVTNNRRCMFAFTAKSKTIILCILNLVISFRVIGDPR